MNNNELLVELINPANIVVDMNPFETFGYLALGFVPTILAMKIGWDLARKKTLLSDTYKKRHIRLTLS